MTIYHIPGKYNVVADNFSHHPDLAVIVRSFESGLLTQIHEAQVAASVNSWEQLKKAKSACEYGFMLHDGLLSCTYSGNEVSLVILEDAELWTDLLQQFHDEPCGEHFGIYCIVGALSK